MRQRWLSHLTCLFVLCLVSEGLAIERTAETVDELNAAIAEMNVSNRDFVIILTGQEYTEDIIRISPSSNNRKRVIRGASTPGPILSGAANLDLYRARNVEIRNLRFERSVVPTGYKESALLMIDLCRSVVVKDCEFWDADDYQELKQTAQFIAIRLSRQCEIRDNKLGPKSSQGDMCYITGDEKSQDRHHVYNNEFTDFYADATGASFLRIGNGVTFDKDTYCHVYDNLFANFNVSFETEIISNKACSNYYYGNTFTNCIGHLKLRRGRECQVYNNRFIDVVGGVFVHGSSHLIYNNYFEGNTIKPGWNGSIAFGGGGSADAEAGYEVTENCVVAFNTIVDSRLPFDFVRSAGVVYLQPTFPRNNLIQHNLVYYSPNMPYLASYDYFVRVRGWDESADFADWSTNTFSGNLFSDDWDGQHPDLNTYLSWQITMQYDGNLVESENLSIDTGANHEQVWNGVEYLPEVELSDAVDAVQIDSSYLWLDFDIDGMPRSDIDGYDIGAHEVSP